MAPRVRKRIKGKKHRPTAADKEKRINTIMTMLLSGARRAEILEFTGTKWGISRAQTDAYIATATAIIKAEAQKTREEKYEEQTALRRMLRKRAMGDGDLRLALDVAKDEAKLHDLYPSEKYDLTAAVAVKGYKTVSPDDWDNDAGNTDSASA